LASDIFERRQYLLSLAMEATYEVNPFDLLPMSLRYFFERLYFSIQPVLQLILRCL
jgi:hypothetical protein